MTNTNIYLPFISKYNDPRTVFANLVLTHPSQQRKTFVYAKCLEESANEKAKLLLELDVWNHVVNGVWPNDLVRRHCNNLAPEYEPNKNYVESLVKGAKEPEIAFAHLLLGEKHREHVLGLNEFYQQQQFFGIGYYSYNNNYIYCFHAGKLV